MIPNTKAQLAALLTDLGQPAEAKPLLAAAHLHYSELPWLPSPGVSLACCSLYLGIGGQPALALKLAEENLRLSRSLDAQLLVVEAATAGHAPRGPVRWPTPSAKGPACQTRPASSLSRAYSACQSRTAPPPSSVPPAAPPRRKERTWPSLLAADGSASCIPKLRGWLMYRRPGAPLRPDLAWQGRSYRSAAACSSLA